MDGRNSKRRGPKRESQKSKSKLSTRLPVSIASKNPKSKKVQGVAPMKKYQIPKKTANTGLLRKLELNSTEYTLTISTWITNSFFYENSIKKIRIDNAYLVSNTSSEEQFLKKKREMRENGRNDGDLKEIHVYSYAGDQDEMKKICRNGLTVSDEGLSVLGRPDMGVYVSKHADLITSEACETGFIIMFKLIKGKVKCINEIRELMTDQEPTPEYDCHTVKGYEAVQNQYRAYRRNQYYVFEYGEDDGMPVKRPRQLTPYAVCHFTRVEPPKTETNGYQNSQPNDTMNDKSSKQTTKEVSRRIIEYRSWEGTLLHNGIHIKLALVSPQSCNTTLYTYMTQKLRITSFIHNKELMRLLPPVYLCTHTSKQNVVYQKRMHDIFLVEASPGEKDKPQDVLSNQNCLRELICCLAQYNSVGVVWLSDVSCMYLLPNSDLTKNRMGLKSGKDKNFLHAIVITPSKLVGEVNAKKEQNLRKFCKQRDPTKNTEPNKDKDTLDLIMAKKPIDLRFLNIPKSHSERLCELNSDREKVDASEAATKKRYLKEDEAGKGEETAHQRFHSNFKKVLKMKTQHPDASSSRHGTSSSRQSRSRAPLLKEPPPPLTSSKYIPPQKPVTNHYSAPSNHNQFYPPNDPRKPYKRPAEPVYYAPSPNFATTVGVQPSYNSYLSTTTTTVPTDNLPLPPAAPAPSAVKRQKIDASCITAGGAAEKVASNVSLNMDLLHNLLKGKLMQLDNNDLVQPTPSSQLVKNKGPTIDGKTENDIVNFCAAVEDFKKKNSPTAILQTVCSKDKIEQSDSSADSPGHTPKVMDSSLVRDIDISKLKASLSAFPSNTSENGQQQAAEFQVSSTSLSTNSGTVQSNSRGVGKSAAQRVQQTHRPSTQTHTALTQHIDEALEEPFVSHQKQRNMTLEEPFVSHQKHTHNTDAMEEPFVSHQKHTHNIDAMEEPFVSHQKHKQNTDVIEEPFVSHQKHKHNADVIEEPFVSHQTHKQNADAVEEPFVSHQKHKQNTNVIQEPFVSHQKHKQNTDAIEEPFVSHQKEPFLQTAVVGNPAVPPQKPYTPSPMLKETPSILAKKPYTPNPSVLVKSIPEKPYTPNPAVLETKPILSKKPYTPNPAVVENPIVLPGTPVVSPKKPYTPNPAVIEVRSTVEEPKPVQTKPNRPPKLSDALQSLIVTPTPPINIDTTEADDNKRKDEVEATAITDDGSKMTEMEATVITDDGSKNTEVEATAITDDGSKEEVQTTPVDKKSDDVIVISSGSEQENENADRSMITYEEVTYSPTRKAVMEIEVLSDNSDSQANSSAAAKERSSESSRRSRDKRAEEYPDRYHRVSPVKRASPTRGEKYSRNQYSGPPYPPEYMSRPSRTSSRSAYREEASRDDRSYSRSDRRRSRSRSPNSDYRRSSHQQKRAAGASTRPTSYPDTNYYMGGGRNAQPPPLLPPLPPRFHHPNAHHSYHQNAVPYHGARYGEPPGPWNHPSSGPQHPHENHNIPPPLPPPFPGTWPNYHR